MSSGLLSSFSQEINNRELKRLKKVILIVFIVKVILIVFIVKNL
jgi:predicted nucleic acid-binding Zn ribbon protein